MDLYNFEYTNQLIIDFENFNLKFIEVYFLYHIKNKENMKSKTEIWYDMCKLYINMIYTYKYIQSVLFMDIHQVTPILAVRRSMSYLGKDVS